MKFYEADDIREKRAILKAQDDARSYVTHTSRVDIRFIVNHGVSHQEILEKIDNDFISVLGYPDKVVTVTTLSKQVTRRTLKEL